MAHPTIDVERKALVEPAASGVYFRDYLALLDRLRTTEEFAVYVAQLNLLRLPPLLKQVCLPQALPPVRGGRRRWPAATSVPLAVRALLEHRLPFVHNTTRHLHSLPWYRMQTGTPCMQTGPHLTHSTVSTHSALVHSLHATSNYFIHFFSHPDDELPAPRLAHRGGRI